MTVAEAIKRPYDNFTILRLVLALAVVFSHAFSVGTGRHTDEPLYALTGYTLGEHGVNGFFAVSGFLVAMSWDRRGGALPFAIARLLRVFPGLIVAVLVTGLVFGTAMTSVQKGQYLADMRVWNFIWVTITTFKSATVLPGVFENNPLRWPISTVWTLRYELICYAGLLAYGVLGGFRHRAVALVGASLVALALVVLAFRGDIPKGQETALRLPLVFAAGSLIYLYRDKIPLSFAAVVSLVPLLTFAAFAAPPLYKPLLFVGTAYLMLFIALAPGLSHPRMEPPGDISYGVYLYGWPVQQVLQALYPAISPWIMLLPALAITYAIAALSWLWIEKPALRLKNRFMAARQ
ncbi:MAG: acyltransferase family protein [Beijerinckiaceae bacterium]